MQVCNILSTTSKLSFLDLSHNEIDSSSVSDAGDVKMAFYHLKTLVLNCTHIQWTALQQCLKMLPKYVISIDIVLSFYISHSPYTVLRNFI